MDNSSPYIQNMKREDKDEYIEEALNEFNAGPTNGTLNDKKRLARIYEVLLDLKLKDL